MEKTASITIAVIASGGLITVIFGFEYTVTIGLVGLVFAALASGAA